MIISGTVVCNTVLLLAFLGQFINDLTEHAAACGSCFEFSGEICQYGLASALVSKCTKYNTILQCYTTKTVMCDGTSHYSTNVQAALGQISTGGGSSHLKEQLAAIQTDSALNLCRLLAKKRDIVVIRSHNIISCFCNFLVIAIKCSYHMY